MFKMYTLEKFRQFIAASQEKVFFTHDFPCTNKTYLINKLLETEELYKISTGIYCKSQISRITGKRVIAINLIYATREALQRLGFEILESYWEKRYREGTTNQVPTGRCILLNKRTKRKFTHNGINMHLKYKKIPCKSIR